MDKNLIPQNPTLDDTEGHTAKFRPAPVEDVDGHAYRHELVEDVEGHGKHNPGTRADDVEGHARRI